MSNAQYVGQINNASTLYNPSFVGSKNALRVASGVNTTQYNEIQYGKPNTALSINSFLAADMPIKKISGAVGFSYINEFSNINEKEYINFNIENTKIVENTFNITYAQIFTIRNKEKKELISIRPSITFGVEKYKLSTNNFIKLNYQDNFLIHSILFTGKKYFIGAKITSDTKLFYNYSSNIIGGYTFQKKESKFSFTPIIEFHFNDYILKHSETLIKSFKCLNLNFKYAKVLWGINEKGIMTGYQNDKLRICLSFLPNYKNTTTLCEVSANYIFKKK